MMPDARMQWFSTELRHLADHVYDLAQGRVEPRPVDAEDLRLSLDGFMEAAAAMHAKLERCAPAEKREPPGRRRCIMQGHPGSAAIDPVTRTRAPETHGAKGGR